MNSKLCKKLRRIARQQTEGVPLVVYDWEPQRGNMFVHPRCTRGVYLGLKKVYR